MINSQQLPPHVPSAHMENPNQNVSPSPQLSQGYSQLQSSGWSGNKVCQATHGQNSNMEPYPQQINRFYQTPYSPHQNAADMSRYMNAAPNSHHSVPAATYNPQYVSSRQSSYSNASPQTYQSSINNACGNTFYGNVNSQTTYGVNNMSPQQRKYAGSPLCPTRATQGLSQNVAQISHNVGNVGGTHQSLASYSQPTQQQRYVNNYNVQSTEAQQPCGARHQLTPTSLNIPTSQDSPPVQSTAVHSINQLSSIPTPPEASSLPGDVAPVNDLVGMEGSLDSAKPKQVTSPSFVLPCSSAIYSSSNLSSATYSVVTVVGNNYENSRAQNRTSGSSLQPPPNVDEGSQASSASASSSIPDEQNSMKANSKPNFSYPPTPNTLSSPGAASMSSFHDDLDCMSSPGWPRTPASPVANNNYEFSNIKRPDSLLKLYNLSEDPERRYFLDKLLLFNEDRGTPITQCPTISKQPLDVYRVYLAVKERGGFVEVTNAKRWKDIAGAIGVGASSSAAYTLRKQYMKLLLPFECKFDRGGIDPQPIINQVEASSRKKGKNTMNSGTQNHFNQGYSQTMDGYHHSNYSAATYPSSRYTCNTGAVDYHCPPNTMHYPQPSAVHPPSGTTNTAASGQTHYSQYWHNQQQAYGYYKGNNAPIRPPVHNNNNNSNYSVNSNICRYSNNVTSQASEQEYYSQHYVPHQNPAVQNNTFMNRSRVQGDVTTNTYPVNQVPPAQTDAKLVNYRGIQPPVENSQNNSAPPPAETVPAEHMAPRKQAEDSYVSSAGSSSCLSNDSPVQDPMTCYNGNYSSTKTPSEQCIAPPVNDCATIKASAPTMPQVPQPNIENTLNKAYQPNCSGSGSTATSMPCHSPSNFTPPQYSQQMPHHTEFQVKAQQNHASQYGQYVESQNENYRGSEGPPSFQNQQVEQSAMCKVTESPTINIPVCQSTNSSSSPAKTTNYVAYSQPQPQVANKEHRTPPVASKDQYNRQPTKAAWPSEPQCQYPTPPTQSFPPRGGKSASKQMKCVPETARQAKAWPPPASTEAPQTDSKPPPPSATNDRVTDVPTQKTQPPASTLIPPNCFQLRNTRNFPPGSVEAVTPVYPRRKRYNAKDVSPLEAWRLMLALKSGLIGECTWALDVLSVLLCDNSSIIYFGLSHLPGLLEVLVEHYRRFLNVIFGLAEDLEVGSKTVSPKVSKSEIQSTGEITKDSNTSSSGLCVQKNHVGINCRERTVIFDTKNYTYETRCKKSVRIKYDEALFLIDPERKWDKYEGFDSGVEHWQAGGGETSMYIETPFKDVSGRVKFARDLELEKLKADGSSKNKFRAPVIIKNFSLKYYKRNSLPLPLLTYKGEPFVVLEKCSVDSIKRKHSARSAESSDTDTEDEESSLSGDGGEACSKGSKRKADEVFEDKQQNKEYDSPNAKVLCKGNSSGTDVASSSVCVSCKSGSSKAESSLVTLAVSSCENNSSSEINVVKNSVAKETGVSTAESSSSTATPTESCSVCMGKKEKSDTGEENQVFFPRLRCGVSSRKKYSSEDLEDEANCFDEPALCTVTEQQEALTRRCMCISNILRNLSFVPGNDLEMKKHPSLLLLLGRLLLLHHEHKPITHQKYDKETKGITVDDSSVSLKDEQEWWWSLLHVLRDNTLVILSNIAGQLDLTPFPEEISLSILDGLLHWVVCPSSYAQDPLPTQPSFSVLSPQRLSLEALCKLSVLENNVDLMIATPPWSRIESFFSLLTKLISVGEDQVVREFAIILLCNISQADSTAARAIAAQNSCISHLIAFIEQAETSAFQIASSQGIKALKENPELMGTTPDMVQRAASTLKCLASVPENRGLFFRHQQRLLAVATSQIMDQELASIIADILFCISEDESETLSVMTS